MSSRDLGAVIAFNFVSIAIGVLNLIIILNK